VLQAGGGGPLACGDTRPRRHAYISRIDRGDEMPESERLARRYFALFGSGLTEELLEVVHPEIELALRTQPGTVLHGREEVAAFVREISGRSYQTVAWVYAPVDESRIVVEGRIQWTDDERVLRDDPVVWALEFCDGLLLRSTTAQTTLEAESIIASWQAVDESSEPG